MLRQFLCIITVFLLTISIGFAQVVHIPDTNLQQAIQEELGITPPFTQEDMTLLTRLYAIEKDIVNIQGLEFAVHLTDLELAGNPVKDISPLQGLMNLTELGLGTTNLLDSDLSPLASLTALVVLDLGDNQISDLSPLAALTNLRKVGLQDNQISDLSPLSALTNLRVINLRNNPLSDLRPLSNLINLEDLNIPYCRVSDVSPLAGLENLWKLRMHYNLTRDFTPLLGLKNLTDFDYGGICEIAPLPPPTTERIKNRTFPSIGLPHIIFDNTEPFRQLSWWDNPDTYYDVAARHDLYYYADRFRLGWHPTLTEPTYGLATRLVGEPKSVMAEYQKFADRNPNMLFIPTIEAHIHSKLDAFPPDSDFWLRDADGQVIKNDVPWDEYMIDILNPEVQQLIIDRVVGIAECGYLNGVMFDAWAPFHIGTYGKYYNIGEEEVIAVYITILKAIRARVRDDFLILVNRNLRKSPRYAEWINGSLMETGWVYPGSFTYKGLIEIEDALSWNEEHLREPRINVLHAEGVPGPIGSPDNLRWMRVFTTLSLTHSDGYCAVKSSTGGAVWYDFWNADLGQPVEEKGQLCDGCDGLFIREFTNGWAVYNRSGKPQKIQLPMQVTGVESGLTSTTHIVRDLDGEMYLKQETDTLGDGTIKVLELAIDTSQESTSEWMPDPALRAVVREALEALGLPAAAPMTKEKMLLLSSLEANHRGIVDITGLEFAMGLRELHLGGQNRITDLRPLANLTSLVELHIWHRRIADIPPVTNLDVSPLAGLINLERLTLENSGISDISPLAGLKKLQVLGLSHNTIEDFSPLAGLTNLWGLRIWDNPSTDFSSLAGLDLTDFRHDIDVNEDGVVNILDLVFIAQYLDGTVPHNPEIDVNDDGIINVLDLILVAQHLGGPTVSAAPAITSDTLDAAVIQAWIEQAHLENDGSIAFQHGIVNLQRLLASLIPEKTKLLANYPNPFNPETWIPYHLANASDVTITIYDARGAVVRQLDLGHQREGYYTHRSRAAYWDGRNDVGERVASGIYFYQLQVDNVSRLRKMVILK